MKKLRPHPVYDFGFWRRGVHRGLALPRIGASEHPRHRRTAAGAKDSLFARLALLEKSTKVPGERELCRRLLGTWKATAAMRMQDFVFWEEKGIWSPWPRPSRASSGSADGHGGQGRPGRGAQGHVRSPGGCGREQEGGRVWPVGEGMEDQEGQESIADDKTASELAWFAVKVAAAGLAMNYASARGRDRVLRRLAVGTRNIEEEGKQ